MNFKEFDYKQFLLEKGEQVALGVAVTLMVLMLIFSLFMPSKGFFSGSPKDKAAKLEEVTKKLETDLRTKDIPNEEKPEPTEGRLINLDIAFLQPKNYEVPTMFEPRIQESPDRRPPRIFNVEEAVVADAHVLIDTYMFSADFKEIWILQQDEGRTRNQPNAAGAAGANPFARMGRGAGGGGMAMMAGGGARGGRGMPGNMPGVRGLNGPASNDQAYTPKLIPVEQWNNTELTARQPRPLRVAVIGGSFPYKRQLEEFKNRLHLPDIDAVLNEYMSNEKQTPSFEFRGVEIQRMEVDANGKPVGDWIDLKLGNDYRLWLKWTNLPFQPEEDPKLEVVKMEGLTAPLLREFHPDKKVDPTMAMGMGRGNMGAAGMRMLQTATPQAAGTATSNVKSKYPDVAALLPKIQATLKKMTDDVPTRIAAPKTRPGEYDFDPFHPDAPPPANPAEQRPAGAGNEQNTGPEFIPDYVLVRAVDVNLEPGKRYRYRLRIKMNNPNYKRSDVASPEYKEQETLTSQDWKEIETAVQLPPELHYYVVDEKKLVPSQVRTLMTLKRVSSQSRMWADRGPTVDQVVFQFHRWIEDTPLNRKEGDVVPVGDWAVADRVMVSRGEYVGRRVRVDLPIWKYMQNAYVLPAEDLKGVPARKQTTGLDVDFGFDSSPKEDMILVDFEGGRVTGPAKIDDSYRTEVLMLAPDGKLLARNSVKDTEDRDRVTRREEVLKRIENVRAGRGAE